jgi:splicing factor 3B subunit 3
VIALSGGELVYFEMDMSGQLNEYTDRKEMGCEVICMALGSVPINEQRSRFLAVGLADNTVRVISLDPTDCLSPLSMQALPASPESLAIVEMGNRSKNAKEASTERLYLNVGLQNGVLLRTVLDHVSGDLSDTRTRYLGTRPVKLFTIRLQNNEAVLAISSRCWLLYHYQTRFHLTPLSYDLLEYASGFASEQCPEGIVAIASNTLRILSFEKLGNVFNSQTLPLEYTPRKFAIHPERGHIVSIETDHNAYTAASKKARKQQLAEEMVELAGEDEQEQAAEQAAAFLAEDLPELQFGAPKPGRGKWASVLRLFDPATSELLDKHEFEQDEAAFSMVLMRFNNYPDQWFIVVGVADELQLAPRRCSAGKLYVFRLIENACRLELMHVTPVEEAPHAMAAFQGRLVAGVGRLLRLYELGKKKLLRKSENKHIPNMIVSLHAMGQRLYVCDVQESVFFVRYRREDNQMVIFADDITPRYVTAATLLDYSTIAVGDKFGNLSIIRLPKDTNDDVDDDPTGVKSLWDRGWLGGASQKIESIAEFHVEEVITSLQKGTLIHGLSECLIYTTLSGTIGIVVPFASAEDHDFFQNLEMHLRTENSPLCGRDHLSFRSYHYPVKNMIDGDLCEQFNSLPITAQKAIAEQLDRIPAEVSKQLEDLRTQYAF